MNSSEQTAKVGEHAPPDATSPAFSDAMSGAKAACASPVKAVKPALSGYKSPSKRRRLDSSISPSSSTFDIPSATTIPSTTTTPSTTTIPSTIIKPSITTKHSPTTASSAPSTLSATTKTSVSTQEPPASATTSITAQAFSELQLHLEMEQIVLSGFASNGASVMNCFKNASKLPPITSESLSELELHQVTSNPRLRYDVNFDRNLHFRPDFEGSKGLKKIQLAKDYWKGLEAELSICAVVLARKAGLPAHDPANAYWDAVLKRSQVRLPNLFCTIRDIMLTLVPETDRSSVSERLDVPFLMQMIEHGVCDLVSLGQWLARVLKQHCAPMRDRQVDRMPREIERGTLSQKPAVLVSGIRQVISILEDMKLDVANHQIRQMRINLVNDTVKFHRKYNASRLATGRISASKSQAWLKREREMLPTAYGNLTPLQVLTSGVLRGLLFDDVAPRHPGTFALDVERLGALRSELHSTMCQRLCLDTLLDLLGPSAPQSYVKQLPHALLSSVSAIIGASGRVENYIEPIAVEITRILLEVAGQNPPFDAGLLQFVEDRLFSDLNRSSSAFEGLAVACFEQWMPLLQTNVANNINLSAFELQEKFVPAPVWQDRAARGAATRAAIAPSPPRVETKDALINKLTHIIVLHWQVWADLVYLAPTEGEPETHPTPPPSAEGTSYSPVRNWLRPARQCPPTNEVSMSEAPTGLPTPASSPRPEDSSSSAANAAGTADPSTSPSAGPAQGSNDDLHQQPA